MTLESLDKLRGTVEVYAAQCDVGWMLDGLEEIEAEIESRYMLLPVDVDGVPIRDGDIVTIPNEAGGNYDVFAVARDYWVDIDGFTHKPVETLHVKPRTIEDVLANFASKQHGITKEENDALIAECAAEIRELMEVDDGLSD